MLNNSAQNRTRRTPVIGEGDALLEKFLMYGRMDEEATGHVLKQAFGELLKAGHSENTFRKALMYKGLVRPGDPLWVDGYHPQPPRSLTSSLEIPRNQHEQGSDPLRHSVG
ncbi:hypothetical protein FRB94_009103 [Tulasnella sp. JGI-2019a]|nr:hypothetical protein FRB94_009103 [Tulasnella sp. JGI-2019a]KAG9026307.1 hypothetical protein FRB95_009004 [Tulasnella sp. JGI-2019a]